MGLKLNQMPSSGRIVGLLQQRLNERVEECAKLSPQRFQVFIRELVQEFSFYLLKHFGDTFLGAYNKTLQVRRIELIYINPNIFQWVVTDSL
jgi:hypothetical protein